MPSIRCPLMSLLATTVWHWGLRMAVYILCTIVGVKIVFLQPKFNHNIELWDLGTVQICL